MGLFGRKNGQMDISAPRMKKPKEVKPAVIRSKPVLGVQSWLWKLVHLSFLLHVFVLVAMVGFPNYIDWVSVAGGSADDTSASVQWAYVYYCGPALLALLLGAVALSFVGKPVFSVVFLAVNLAAALTRAVGLGMGAGDDFADYGGKALALFACEVALAFVEEALVLVAVLKKRRERAPVR